MKRFIISFISIICSFSYLASAQTGTAISSLPYTISTNGDYYLSKTITTASTNILVKVNAGVTATLDMNGHDIESTAATTIIENAGTLTITNSAADPSTNPGRINGKNVTGVTRGRGIHNTGTLTINGGRVVSCRANGGGGIWNDGGTLTIDAPGIVVNNCWSVGKGQGGGGILNRKKDDGGYAKFYFKNGIIQSCSTAYERETTDADADIKNFGAGVWNAAGCTFQMSGGTIQNCTSKFKGGGVWNDGSMTMTGGTIKGCSSGADTGFANGDGGGIYNTKRLTITKGTITGNTANFQGGGIFVTGDDSTNEVYLRVNAASKDDVKIDGNKAVDWGGGIMIKAGELTISNGSVTNNSSSNYGGGIASSGATVTISGGYIAGNTAWYCGGGFHSGASSHTDLGDPNGDNTKLIIENNKVTKSRADKNEGGGGVSVGKAGHENEMKIYACTIRSNSSNLYGGGIYCRTLAEVTDNNIVIGAGLVQGNTAVSGAGVFFTGTVKMTGGTFDDNTATDCGGAIYMGGDNEFTMEGGVISNNEANDGGGVWAGGAAGSTTGAKITITGGEITGNKAGQFGGGFYANGTIQISAAQISGNSAVKDGGGFYVAGGSTTIQGGAVLSGNSSDRGGAAFLKGTNKFLGAATRVTGNSARLGGAFFVANGNTTVSAGTIQSNSSTQNGGAIYANNGTLTINGAKFSRNSATANGGCIFSNATGITMTNGEISNNTSSGNGAGIFNTQSDITLKGGIIDHNIAVGNGGGIYSSGGTITIKEDEASSTIGEIIDNTAKNGGGLYLTNVAKIIFEDGLITGNRAKSSGVSIKTAYQSDPSLAGGEISGVGGGVYLGAGTDSSNKVKLTFQNNESVGVYRNYADNAADDLFADAKNTSMNLPLVADVPIEGFAGKANGWYADYVTDDIKYSEGLFNTGSGIRFRSFSDPDDALMYTGDLTQKTKYVCLALGIRMSKLTIKKTGLKEGESAVFLLTNPEALAPRKIVLTGVSDDGTEVSTTFAKIEAGTWTVSEADWAWTYTPDSESKQVVMDTKDEELSFSNTKKTDVPANDEAIKKNVLSGTESD